MKSKTFSIIAFTVSGIILSIVLALNIVIGVFADTIDKYVIGYQGGGNTATRAEGKILGEQIQAEGTVLLKNEDETLPLDYSETKVNVFGWAATDWVISGSGSGQVKRYGSTDFLAALKAYGVSYNEELIEMYEDFRSHREFSINGVNAGSESQCNPLPEMGEGSGALHSFNYEFSRLYEPDIDDKNYYSNKLLNNALDYSDTALIVIGRVSGESNDMPAVQYKKGAGSGMSKGMPSASETDKSRTYLEISEEEEKLLEYVGDNYDNVVVIINSTNTMELGFLDTIPGLDACLLVATTGTAGANAIPQILYGDITPSGKTVDTYAYDLSTAASYVNAAKGDSTLHFYTNGRLGSGLYPTTVQNVNGSSNVSYEGVAYQDYCEGIYVGYKWYETADAEKFWDTSYAQRKWGISNGYEDVVQFPFGYGMSYTEFEWTIKEVNFKNNSVLTEKDVIKIGIEVKNVGDYDGQDVVELYYSAPYTPDGIEKSAICLGAFGKTTQVLEPEETEYVELEFPVSEMASYDYEGKKIPGGGYVLEEGKYTISLRTDAHTLAGSKITDSGVYDGDTLNYEISEYIHCKNESSNKFTGSSAIDGVALDGNSDGSAHITYLSRSNFVDTFPAVFGDDRAMTEKIKALNIYTVEDAEAYKNEHAGAQPVTFGNGSQKMLVGSEVIEDGNKHFKLNDLGFKLGMDFDAKEWDDLLSVITKEEMQNLVLHGFYRTHAVKSIGKPETRDSDGPNQMGSWTDDFPKNVGFSSIVLAQSWNAELAYSMGLAVGTQAAECGITGWCGPGVNIHRSPFAGRNYEYYSEDSFFTGVMCSKVITAAKNRGVYCYLKHLCLYETESGRDSMYTWVTEQALREIYLKPFEMAIKNGATAMMSSYGRIGAVWNGGSKALLTGVVRTEWKFDGAIITDYADHLEYMNIEQAIRAGGDLWMDGFAFNAVGAGYFRSNFDTTSNAYNNALRTSAKHILYAWMNALATNMDYNEKVASGGINDDIVTPTVPKLNFRWYIPVLVVADVVLVAGCGVWIFFAVRKMIKKSIKATSEEIVEDSVDNNGA